MAASFCEICQIAEVLAEPRLQSASVRITGRCEAVCWRMQETVGCC